MGHSACLEAMNRACELAKESGIAMVGVYNGSHCGALSYFMMQAISDTFSPAVPIEEISMSLPC